MSLTEEGYRERKWGSFPAIRKALEDKKVPDKHYGITSAHDNMFDSMGRLTEIATLVSEYQSAIKEMAVSIGWEEMCSDLERLGQSLKQQSYFFEEKERVVKTLYNRLKEEALNSVRFERMCLHNYGAFLGAKEFIFDEQRTLIIGRNGTGKTTIMKALANLGPAQGVKPHLGTNPPEMSVIVSTRGNRELVKKYESVIFFDGESLNEMIESTYQEAVLADVLSDQHRNAIKDEEQIIFQAITKNKPWIIEAHRHRDQTIGGMPGSERICLGYSFVFAVRKVLNLNLPIVIDNPYGCIDSELRDGLHAFLRQQKCQQILLLNEFEYIEDGDDVHSQLDRAVIRI